MANSSIITCCPPTEESASTLPLENACSHMPVRPLWVGHCSCKCAGCKAKNHCQGELCLCEEVPLHRHDGASLLLVELRKQAVIDIAVHVAHIRQLCMLEAGI